MVLLNKLCLEMINYFSDDAKRIMHLTNVHAIAKLIAEEELVDKQKQFIIEAVSYIHDIGVKPSEAKYNSSNGKYQEEEGPKVATQMLTNLGFAPEDIDRITYIIANHHTYEKIDDIDFQILVEADLIANFYEDKISKDTILAVYDKYFKTDAGMHICDCIFGIKQSL